MPEYQDRPKGEYTGRVSISHRLTAQSSKVVLIPDDEGEFNQDNVDKCEARMKDAVAKLNADPEIKLETTADIVICEAHKDAKKHVPKLFWSRYSRTTPAGEKDYHPIIMKFDPLRYSTSRGGGQQKAKFTKIA